MAQLDKTFPTMDCFICPLAQKIEKGFFTATTFEATSKSFKVNLYSAIQSSRIFLNLPK